MAVPLMVVIGGTFDASVATMGVIISLGEFAGLAAPLLCRSVDRQPRGRSIQRGLALVAAAATLAAVSPSLSLLGVAFITVALGNILFGAAAGAYVADQVPLTSRSAMLGRLELSWSVSLVLGVPAAALIADLMSWRVTYALIAAAAAVAAFTLPNAAEPTAHPVPAVRGPRGRWRHVIPLIGGVTVLVAASQVVFVVYGAWLNEELGWGVGRIGLLAMGFGLGELGAVLATMRLADKLGQRTSSIFGALALSFTGLALALLTNIHALGVILIGLIMSCFEFALISLKPLIAEAVTTSRALVLSLAESGGTVGRAIGSLAGVFVYTRFGMSGAALVCAGLAGCFVTVLVLSERTWRDPSDAPA